VTAAVEGKAHRSANSPGASEDADDLGGSVTISPSVTFQVQTAAQTQGTVNVDLVIISASVSEAFQSAVNEVESIGRSYTANLTYAEPKPSQPSTIKKLFQQEVFFAVRSDNARLRRFRCQVQCRGARTGRKRLDAW